jgi:VWFA-related protein
MVRVIVRDSRGKAVSGLKQGDFEVFDNKKQRPVVSFSEVSPARVDSGLENNQPRAASDNRLPPPALPSAAAAQSRDFIIYLFDDMHMKLGELDHAREAVGRHVKTLPQQPSQRAAIFSTSGKVRQPFTNNPSDINAVLAKLVPQNRKLEDESSCPYMNYYIAQRLETDSVAKGALITDAVNCLQVAGGSQKSNADCSGLPQPPQLTGEGEPPACDIARQVVEAAMRRELVSGELDGWTLLSALDGAIRQLATVKGVRKIVLLSPGFTVEPRLVAERLEHALRSEITVDVVDARGLWVSSLYDAEQGRFSQKITPVINDSEQSRSDSIVQIADGTGGRYFRNSNDLDSALNESDLSAAPSYLLAFSPEKIRNNGSFHQIKVKLISRLDYHVTARRGYYEPSKADAAERATVQLRTELFFSEEERGDIPLSVTVYFGQTKIDGAFELAKANGNGIFETIASARIGIQSLHFRRDRDRWDDSLTEICGVFDSTGNFISAVQNTTKLHLRRTQISSLASGITVDSKFQLKPGSYIFRIVVQDQEGRMISARSVSVPVG